MTPVDLTSDRDRAIWLDGHRWGHAHGWTAGYEARQAELHALAVPAGSAAPVADPRFLTAASDELTALAGERRAAGIERFRADHERRRSALASGGAS